MSSETSTDRSTFRPWHFFVLGALVAATVGVVIARPTTPAGTVFMTLAIGASALVGLGVLRTLWPLAAADVATEPEFVGSRTRAAVEREKALMLRSIKELDFDRAMGKVSEPDFQEMAGRLRTRALNLMRQLDGDQSGYREVIERELRLHVSRVAIAPAADRDEVAPPDEDAAPRRCEGCETLNDADARFCKRCGSSLT